MWVWKDNKERREEGRENGDNRCIYRKIMKVAAEGLGRDMVRHKGREALLKTFQSSHRVSNL